MLQLPLLLMMQMLLLPPHCNSLCPCPLLGLAKLDVFALDHL